MGENIPESCVGASGMPWNLPELLCSHCGRRDAEGDYCGQCGKCFCGKCAVDPNLVLYCNGCDRPYCAECSDSFRGLLGMLTELRAEVKLLDEALKRALLEMERSRVPDESTKRFLATMDALTRSPR